MRLQKICSSKNRITLNSFDHYLQVVEDIYYIAKNESTKKWVFVDTRIVDKAMSANQLQNVNKENQKNLWITVWVDYLKEKYNLYQCQWLVNK